VGVVSLDWLPFVTRAHSPHHSSREGYDVAGIVLHYDGSPRDDGGVLWMQAPASKVSAHLHIDRKGRRTQLVPFDRAAWHAGVSSWTYKGEQTEDANRFTIGIELANLGRVDERKAKGWEYEVGGVRFPYPEDRLHSPVRSVLEYDDGQAIDGWWEGWPSMLIYALSGTVQELRDAFGPLPLIGHEEIAMPLGRKMDPGGAFPWTAFERLHDNRRTTARVPARR
jgi:N-acetylmuramoyl-L-alanine amidase